MPLYGVERIVGIAIVHQTSSGSKTPQRRRTDPVLRVRTTVLNNAIPGTDVVHKEVTERVDDLIPESWRNRERSAINSRSDGSRHDGAHVARDTADPVKDPLTGLSGVGCRKDLVTRRHFRRTHELGEGAYIPTIVLRVCNRVERGDRTAVRRILSRLQRTVDSHFVEIRVR